MPEPIQVKHGIFIVPVLNPKFPYLVKCDCNWQAHCRTFEEAQHRWTVHKIAQDRLKESGGMRSAY